MADRLCVGFSAISHCMTDCQDTETEAKKHRPQEGPWFSVQGLRV